MSGEKGPADEAGRKPYRKGKNKEVPFGDPSELAIFVTYRVSLRMIRRLGVLKAKLGFKSYESAMMHLVNVAEREGMIPPASYKLVFEKSSTKPVIITGESGSGKSTTVKDLLSTFAKSKEMFGKVYSPGNVLIIDTANEYDMEGCRKIDLGRFFALKWEKEGTVVRFVPNPNVEISRAEAATIFSHLNFIKNSGSLKNWCIVIEEAHRFKDDTNLRALLIEARKFVRKLIIVTTDWRVYADIAQVFKPMPWEES